MKEQNKNQAKQTSKKRKRKSKQVGLEKIERLGSLVAQKPSKEKGNEERMIENERKEDRKRNPEPLQLV